eukprot:CAMPEP_0170135856 /NCGR_PEP_ID=MMETSP0033_2-20121228/2759_1 /TAXON_ID=195969 /ORGANISM="Dolichomastix tenuilepis, Strain CCMP3274" /LENGTH=175 /DNA_ID=CAMNT_0010371479 /DNA_START=177 /DNA_END=704 /DNA_ORIENTATION=-
MAAQVIKRMQKQIDKLEDDMKMKQSELQHLQEAVQEHMLAKGILEQDLVTRIDLLERSSKKAGRVKEVYSKYGNMARIFSFLVRVVAAFSFRANSKVPLSTNKFFFDSLISVGGMVIESIIQAVLPACSGWWALLMDEIILPIMVSGLLVVLLLTFELRVDAELTRFFLEPINKK